MKLYLVRHGIAENAREDAADGARRLTALGIERSRAAAAGLARMGCDAQRIVSSPLSRAVETARIFADALGLDASAVEQANALATDGDVSELLAWLRGQPRVPTMLVGHMPGLGLLVTNLICGRSETVLRLKKAGVCLLTSEHDMLPGTWVLEWFLPPDLLRLAGASRAR